MRKFLKMGILLFVLVSIFVTSVVAAPSVSDLQNQKDKAEKEMNSLKDELTAILSEVNRTEQQLIAKGEAISVTSQKLEQAKANEEKQQMNMRKRIVTMYENGNGNLLAMVLESGNIAELLKRIENVQTIHTYDRNELKKFVETRKEIADMKVALEKEQSELQSLQANLVSQQRAMQTKINEKKNRVANLDKQIADAIAEAAQQNQNNVVVGGTNSSGGRPYKGNGDQSVGNAIVAAARTYIGVWYEWGGNDYSGIDCSGLTKAAHRAVGITIDRWSGHQAIGGKSIGSLAEALPGDIICYPGHVAIYIGNNRVIHAPQPGEKVKEANVFMGGTMEITAIRRYW